MIDHLVEILGIFLAALLAAQFGFIQQRRTQNHDRDLQFRRDRFELYSRFTDASNQLVAAAKLGQEPYNDARCEFLKAYEGLRLITSSSMLCHINQLHSRVLVIDTLGEVEDDQMAEFNQELHRLVQLIRVDLGVAK